MVYCFLLHATIKTIDISANVLGICHNKKGVRDVLILLISDKNDYIPEGINYIEIFTGNFNMRELLSIFEAS